MVSFFLRPKSFSFLQSYQQLTTKYLCLINGFMCYFPYKSHSRLYITIQCQFSWKKGCRSGMPTKTSNKTSEDCQISHLQWEIGMLIKYSKGYQISQQTCWKKNTNIVLSFQYIENLYKRKATTECTASHYFTQCSLSWQTCVRYEISYITGTL